MDIVLDIFSNHLLNADFLLAFDFAGYLSSGLRILYVALGLGMVIFFHELGHYGVAKWCDVNVERFSIGFGPIIWSKKWGETEYALSAIPFGGYVKMLGQDDMDPSQLSQEEIAEDPRSYSAKTVGQRMAIISAGVIMNLITAALFFTIAFGLGVKKPAPVIGFVVPGGPAWKAGILPGDTITKFDGTTVTSFEEIYIGSALASGDVKIEGVHADGSAFKVIVHPETTHSRPRIGVLPSRSVKLAALANATEKPVAKETAAAKASPGFQQNDLIVKVGETKIESFVQLQTVLARKKNEVKKILVERKVLSNQVDETTGKKIEKITEHLIEVAPTPFRTIGLMVECGKITAVKKGSPAEAVGLKEGDKPVKIDGKDVGMELNSLHLPDYFWEHRNDKIELIVRREVKGSEAKEVALLFDPVDQNKKLLDRPGWVIALFQQDGPLAVPAAGFTFELVPTILKVQPGSPAEKAGILPNARLLKLDFFVPEEEAKLINDKNKTKDITFLFSKEQKDEIISTQNYAVPFSMMQRLNKQHVRLTYSLEGKEKSVELVPESWKDESDPQATWNYPVIGIILDHDSVILLATGPVSAMKMGGNYTRNSVINMYLTFANLGRGNLSVTEFSGPLGILTIAYKVTEQGVADFLLFLGILSINLAVINFLPIPVLDGGHMVFLIWEGVTRKKPSEAVINIATYCGMAFILGLMGLVIYLDVTRLM